MTARYLTIFLLAFLAGALWLFFERPMHDVADVGNSHASALLENDSKHEGKKEVQEEQIGSIPLRKPEEDYLSNYPMTLAVPFSSGESVDISYKLLDHYYLPKPNDVGRETFIEELTNLAQNDNAGAAEVLADYLDVCATSPRNKDALDVAIAAFSQTNLSDDQRAYAEPFASPEFVNEYYQICKNVSDEDIENRNDWREKAVELGGYQSLSGLSNDLIDSDPERHFELIMQAWDKGYIGIGNSIASNYFLGSAPHLNGQADYVTGYAYQLAGEMVIAEFLKQSKGINASRGLSLSDQSLGLTSVNLSPQELIDAEKLARQLLQENGNCCISIWPTIGQ